MIPLLPKVAFVHIPRTAGMTLGSILERMYEGHPIQEFYGDASSSVVNDKLQRFAALRSSEKRAFSVLKGHFVFGFTPGLEHFSYVTLLRRPLERLVSYYFYVLRDSRHYLHALLMQRRMRLEDFLFSDLSLELDNYQVRAVSGALIARPRDRVVQEHLELATYNLRRRFSAFGLAEEFDESLFEFARVFGWKLPKFEVLNQGGYSRNLELPKSCRDAVNEKNRFDVALYEYASGLFMQRRAQATDSVSNNPH